MVEFARDYTSDVERRFRYFVVLVLALCLVLIVRLYQLQVIKGDYYRFFSLENSIKQSTIAAPRGEIFDRRGKLLVGNRPSFDVVLIPQYVNEPGEVLNSLNKLLSIDSAALQALWAGRKNLPSYMPLVVKRDVSFSEVGIIRTHKGPWHTSQHMYNLSGVEVVVRYLRQFSDPMALSHLVGYVKEIDSEKLKALQNKFPNSYFRGDTIGIKGIESDWDMQLRGRTGFEQYIVNAIGQRIDYEGIADRLGREEAREGNKLFLTIDDELQLLTKELFKDESGAAVMVDVKDGSVRLLFSSPVYDIEKMGSPQSGKYWEVVTKDPRRPLINRAVHGTYPPASTFKIVNAISSLERGAVKETEKINCAGSLVLGGRPFHCWNRAGHGPIDIHNAIVQSCDVFFYAAGLRLGIDALVEDAMKFGFGRKTGIGISGEKSGLLPTLQWKEKSLRREWQGGDTVSFSIGQGYNLVTPLQNAVMLAQVVNGGKRIKPHLVDAAIDSNGTERYKWREEKAEGIGVKRETLELMKSALTGVVGTGNGTAHFLAKHKYSMGGKTGTAQVVGLERSCSKKECRDHGWFVGFAPADDPKVAVAVIVEHSGFGAGMAAPIAGELLQRYLEIEESSRSRKEIGD